MKFSDECLELFGTIDLYKLFNLDRNGKLTDSKIKKAYYQLSILWHPDRFAAEEFSEADRDLATKKFQVVGRCFSILSDIEKRKLYDETGSLDDDDMEANTNDKDWASVWRGMFKEVTKKDIEEYLRKFRGSSKEMEDVKQAYIKHKGSMSKILSTVIGADVHNEDRIREIIRYFIDKGEAEAYAKFVNEPPSARIKRIKQAEREAKESEKVLKEMQKKEGMGESATGTSGGGGDLASIILAKQQKRGRQQIDFLAQLEQKYAQPQPKRKKGSRKE